MSFILTPQQIYDRLNMYEEAASPMEQAVCETEGEKKQAAAVAAQIRALAKAFDKRHFSTPIKRRRNEI